MDDCSQRGAVTNYSPKSSRHETSRDYFVTAVRFQLSLPVVWTGLALHG
jgi:hypothetical protein